jgi:methionyl-tRNA formyltransferase
VNWQILHGETRSGVTLHEMVARADAGDIVDQEAFEIGPDDTPVDVYRKMLPAGDRVIRANALAIVEGRARRIRQMESKATKFGRRRPEDGLIDWRWSAEDVRNLVRAVTKPYPGAFTFASGRRVLVWRVERAGRSVDGPPGCLQRSENALLVQCGDQAVRMTEFEVEGDPRGEALRQGLVLGGSA